MKSQRFSAYCTHKLKNVNNILHLVQKYAPVFVREHHLLQDACRQFPGSKAPGKHRGKCMRDSSISHIVMPNGGYCVYCPSNIFGKVFMTSWLFAMWNNFREGKIEIEKIIFPSQFSLTQLYEQTNISCVL